MMKFNKKIKIGSKVVADNSPVFIIAEAGVNHNGDIDKAKRLIDVAVNAGVDAVKFQAFKTKNVILKNVRKAHYQEKTTGTLETQYEMIKKLEFTKEQYRELINYCNENGIIFLSTPFDDESVDELDEIGVLAYKTASTDTTNLLLLKKIAKKEKPILLSTGMSYLSEVEAALKEIIKYNKDIILLQCTANYPILNSEANLNVLNTYRSMFDIIVGYSDHSVGIGASPYTIPMGAKLVEKHFTLDINDNGPDHKASLSPEQLKEFVCEIRKVEEYLGTTLKIPSFDELKTRKSLQKCLVASTSIKQGEYFTESNIVAKRTGGVGISPLYYKQLIGKKASTNYCENEIIDE